MNAITGSMATEAAAHDGSDNRAEHDEIVLGLLESVERNGEQSQRDLASELGIALGLVNSYLKRCVNKGLLKVQEVPARRYAYFGSPAEGRFVRGAHVHMSFVKYAPVARSPRIAGGNIHPAWSASVAHGVASISEAAARSRA